MQEILDELDLDSVDGNDADSPALKKFSENMDKKRFIFYPTNSFLKSWDVLQMFLLIITCMHQPYSLAFYNDQRGIEPLSNIIFTYLVDGLFLVDIIIIFNTAIVNSNL